MKLELKYFGQVSEWAGIEREEIVLEQDTSISELIEVLLIKYPKLEMASCKIAVNQELVPADFVLLSSCEVAILPPFAGG